MSSKNVSRRSIVPGLAAGAAGMLAVSAAASPSTAASGRKRASIVAGPCGIWPGHNLTLQFFNPKGQRVSYALQCRLFVRDLDGNELVTHDFELQPGSGKEAELAVDADGTLRFNGEIAQAAGLSLVVSRAFLEVLILVARIIIGTAASANDKPRLLGTATSFVPGRAAGEQNVDYLLPFIEQDNL
jgi:hypothetical protein